VEHLLTIFGRAVRPSGQPVANAMITSHRGLGQSNSDGYFEIETSANDVLTFDGSGGLSCKVRIGELGNKLDYAPIGRVLCQ
ncbi:MAG TPA: CS1-pili formation C-terminal domain-containing protein, partial [Sphingomicrobium sp.]|nr:CS1-pili formation C-terminal domain-containing protein [Sphingomicrobium sp.]